MSVKRKVALLAGVVVAIGITVLMWPSLEPVYLGRRLSLWLDELPMTSPSWPHSRLPLSGRVYRTEKELVADRPRVDRMHQKAIEAINALGTNCLPLLIQRLGDGESDAYVAFRRSNAYRAFRIWREKRGMTTAPHSAGSRRYQALTAFLELGERARAVVPELVELAQHAHPKVQETALVALQQVAPEEAEKIKPREFSKTNSIALLLAQAERKHGLPGHGLEHVYLASGGRTVATNMEGVAGRCLNLTEKGYAKGYLYFTIHPTFKVQDVARVKIDVEYFDGFEGQEGVFGLEYDALSSGEDPGSSYKQFYPNVPLRGSGHWLKARFHVRDGAFQNSQNGQGDFRLWASPPELCVGRVSVTLEPVLPALLAKPLSFDAAAEAKLRDWNLQWDSGSKPTFARETDERGIARWLEIRAPGTPTVGSWRTCVLLEAGDYRFAGKVRTAGRGAGTGAIDAVGLRAAGRPGVKGVGRASDGALFYDFTTAELGYVELICELVGSQGSAGFDLYSLKLIRKSKAPN